MSRESGTKVSIMTRKAALAAVGLMAVAGLALVAFVASQQALMGADLQIARWVRSLDFPGLDATFRAISVFTDAPMAITLWVIAGALFVLRGRPLEAVAVFLISGLWLGDALISMLVNRPIPAPELIPGIEFTGIASFPSGHVTGAVAFYGLLTFLTLKNVRRGHLRIIVPALSVLIIGLASVGRVYVAAHWPSDILGSYLFALVGVVAIASAYSGIKEGRFRLPRLWRKQPVPEVPDRKRIARSIASTVYLDPQAGTATKEYNPPWLVRALYRLAFQAPFPYQHRKDALEAAAAKRKIAGLLTKHQVGHDLVAPVYEVRNGGSSYQFVTEFILGTPPRSNKEIEDTLSGLTSYFQEVGLPTWQVAPENPHAYSNFIRTPQGHLKLIDLESAIVSFGAPWKQLGAFMRDGHFPIFDDVDFVQLRRYVQDHLPGLTKSLGPSGYEELKQAVETAELCTRTWKGSEPRIWGRFASRVYRCLDTSKLFGGIRSRLDNAEAMARAFLSGAIERWERDGQIDGEQAASLQGDLSAPEIYDLLRHLGAHLVLSLALRFPIGSAARFAWVLTFRLKARYDLARGRITKDGYRSAQSLHSVPVMLLSLVPGLGTIAYFVSGTIIQSSLPRMAIDQFVHKLAPGPYYRLGLAHVTAPRPQLSRRARAPRRSRRLRYVTPIASS